MHVFLLLEILIIICKIESSFLDVDKDSYYMPYIQWAYEKKIINGIGNGLFAPEQPVSREQMAVIMDNYAEILGFTLPENEQEKTFADSDKIAAYAKEAVSHLQIAGVINGKNGNLFDPGD